MSEFHFLRPVWFIALMPLMIIIIWAMLVNISANNSWQKICDKELLKQLIVAHGKSKRISSLLLLLFAGIFMIISLAGPTWSRAEVPVYKPIYPHVIVLDMSETMLERDLTPDRLARAKFKLHELFKYNEIGQIALIAYTDESFVVSPLTEDAKTIDAILPALTVDIMPVYGSRLDLALKEALNLINHAGFNEGSVLVFTATTPSQKAISAARFLKANNIFTSIIPMVNSSDFNPLFKEFAAAGNGFFIPFTNNKDDIDKWLKGTKLNFEISKQSQQKFPLWHDEGRKFLILALLCLLPIFRRGWLERVKL